MTQRQRALLAYHLDSAKLMTTGRTPVFWVLDLQDEDGLKIASLTYSEDRLSAALESCEGTIPAATVATSIESANMVITTAYAQPPLPAGARAIAIISEGSLTIALLV